MPNKLRLITIVAISFSGFLSYKAIEYSIYIKEKTQVDHKTQLSHGVLSTENGESYKFYIPDAFHPAYDKAHKYVVFHIQAPAKGLPFERIGTTDENKLTINVKVMDNRKGMASYFVHEIEKAAADKNKKLQQLTKVGLFDQYDLNGAIYYVKKDENGLPIVIQDTERSFVGARAYRQLNNHIEIDYVFSKKVSIEQWDILDKYILDTIHSFQTTYNKSLQQAPH